MKYTLKLAKALCKGGAEGAIVGSAFVKIVESNLDKPTKMVRSLSDLAEKLKAATLRANL